MKPHLVIFARQVRLGTGKRRLAAGIGAVQAAAFQRQTMDALMRRVASDSRWRTWIALTPDSAVGKPHMTRKGVTYIAQGSGDLGQRMARIFRTLLPGPVVLIGSDIPAIRIEHIVAAFARLGNHDAVFGPAEDGGYWLVGLKRARRMPGPNAQNLFSNVRWSTRYALSDTVAGLGTPAQVAYVETLADIDTADDLARWRDATRSSGREMR